MKISPLILLAAAIALAGCEGVDDAAAPEAPMPAPQAEPMAEQQEADSTMGGQAVAGRELTAAESPSVASMLLEDPTWAFLFSGGSLENFEQIGGANWDIIDNYVQANNGMEGFLLTRGAYRDFELRAEFWTSPDANSGIFIRCQSLTGALPEGPDAITPEACYEVNIFDQREDQTYRTGGIVDVAEPMAQIDAGNQWNTYVIRAEGPQLTITLNGQVTVDIEDDTLQGGPIALQYGAGVVRFRNVQIRPL